MIGRLLHFVHGPDVRLAGAPGAKRLGQGRPRPLVLRHIAVGPAAHSRAAPAARPTPDWSGHAVLAALARLLPEHLRLYQIGILPRWWPGTSACLRRDGPTRALRDDRRSRTRSARWVTDGAAEPALEKLGTCRPSARSAKAAGRQGGRRSPRDRFTQLACPRPSSCFSRSATFHPPCSSRGEVFPQPLRPGLANVQLSADRAQAMAKAVSDVSRKRRRYARAKQPPRQRGNGVFRRAESSITIELA